VAFRAQSSFYRRACNFDVRLRSKRPADQGLPGFQGASRRNRTSTTKCDADERRISSSAAWDAAGYINDANNAAGNRTWMITLRRSRYYKPYGVTLQKFTHEKYAGTEIPNNFSSRVTLIDPERSVNRDVLIYMNHPLRFWGWDPKENGAVLIVLWCAIILHARWGGFIRQGGLMIMAIFGNVVTSFLWFGVNMLGIGLHSYGFMQKAFPWLIGFIVSQLALMTIATMPVERWRSFRLSAVVPRPSGEHKELSFTPPKLAVETTPE
jgi:hypothetical protein